MNNDNEDKKKLIDDIRDTIIEQIHIQSKMTYRVAFNDGFTFAMNTLISPRRI